MLNLLATQKKKKILKLDDVIDLSSLTDWCYNIHVTKYWLVSGGHYIYMHYLWKNGVSLHSHT